MKEESTVYQFKRVEEAHIPALREIYLYYVNHSTATFHKREISLEEMRDLLIFENPKYESYGIWLENDLCGYVILTKYKEREAFEFSAEVTIYLKNGYEGRGIGSRAIQFIEERAKTKDIHTLLALICGENTGSINLFEKNHYKRCAEYKEVGFKFNRWLDLLCYQKII